MKYTQETNRTRLSNRLCEMGLTFQELQYISERDFLKWRNVGKDLVEYTKLRLAAEGLSFGAYTVDYYNEHKDEIISKSFAKKEQPSDTFNWDAFRREAAKDILAGIATDISIYIRERDRCAAAVKDAIALTDELIKQLRDGKESESH